MLRPLARWGALAPKLFRNTFGAAVIVGGSASYLIVSKAWAETQSEPLRMQSTEYVGIFDVSEQEKHNFPAPDIVDVLFRELGDKAQRHPASCSIRSIDDFTLSDGCISKLWGRSQRRTEVWRYSNFFDDGGGPTYVGETASNFGGRNDRSWGLSCAEAPEVRKRFWLWVDVWSLAKDEGLHRSAQVHSLPSSNGYKEERKKREKGISDFDALAEYRPELGTVLTALIGIVAAFFFQMGGYALWHDGRRFLGTFCLVCGFALAFNSTLGVLLGVDVWSVLRGIR